MDRAVADREAVLPVVGLGPPPVEHRQVQPAVEHHLLAAGAARLERAQRRVEPDVHALHEVPRHVDVVVLDEHQAAGEARVARHLDDLPDQPLAGVVRRVRLAREDDLHRAAPRSTGCSTGGRGRSAGSSRACRWRTAGRSRWSGRAGSSRSGCPLRRRTNSIRYRRSTACVSHNSASSIDAIGSHAAHSLWRAGQSAPR